MNVAIQSYNYGGGYVGYVAGKGKKHTYNLAESFAREKAPMIGQPWKTADKVREILTTLYHDRPDGLSGNEDVGQMSAWYVLSSLGFYQVEPAGGRYFFGSPLFDKAEVRVRDGVLTVTAHNNSAANKYIQAVKLNGKPYTKPYIAFDDIAAGGVLEFEMGAEPAVWYEL